MEESIERSLGRIDESLRNLHDDVKGIKDDMKAAHAALDARVTAQGVKIEKHDGFFAKVAAVAAVVGAVVTFLAEWAWKKVTS